MPKRKKVKRSEPGKAPGAIQQHEDAAQAHEDNVQATVEPSVMQLKEMIDELKAAVRKSEAAARKSEKFSTMVKAEIDELKAAARKSDKFSTMVKKLRVHDQALADLVTIFGATNEVKRDEVLEVFATCDYDLNDECLRKLQELVGPPLADKTIEDRLANGSETPEEVFAEFHTKLRASSEPAASVGVIKLTEDGRTLLETVVGDMSDSVFADTSDVNAAKEALIKRLKELPCQPEGWESIDESLLEAFDVPKLAELMASKVEERDKDGVYKELHDELTQHFSNFVLPRDSSFKYNWLPTSKTGSTEERLMQNTVSSLVNVFVKIFRTATQVDSPMTGQQQCESNVDLAVPIPTVFEFFNDKDTLHLFKERKHQSFYIRESSKGEGAAIIKVDHAVELRTESVEKRFFFAVGETGSAETTKQRVDTSKCHMCSKAELNLLALHAKKELRALSANAFVFSCVCSADRIQLFSYRTTDNFITTTRLCDFEVPTTSGFFTSSQQTEGQVLRWRSILKGLLTVLQLKHLVAAQAIQLKELEYTRPTADFIARTGKITTPLKRGKPPTSSNPTESKKAKRHEEAQGDRSRSPQDQCLIGLRNGTLRMVVTRQTARRNNTTLYFGYAWQLGFSPFYVVVKHVGNSGFREEAHLHQSAASLAPKGVLPLWAWTDNNEMIASLKLDGLSEAEEIVGGVMLMPLAEEWKYPCNQPQGFLQRVWAELCPTLLCLANAGLFHNDLRQDNVMVWQGRLCLMDFGYAAWTRDCVNVRGLACRHHCMQAPELRRPDFEAVIGEPQLVFTLGSLLLYALTTDFEGLLAVDRHMEGAEILLIAFAHLEEGLPTGKELPAGWQHGIPLVLQLLKTLLNPDPGSRPRLVDAVKLLNSKLNSWYAADCQVPEADLGATALPAQIDSISCDPTRPGRFQRSHVNLIHGSA
eukprot:m.97879 g.97879  ORF g.97879 m.97879 type:complete len:930 (-) comp15062_c2_seq7:2048-4837(-)